MSIVIKKKEDCTGCTACKHICSVNCITMEPDNEGFLYPVIDKSNCTECGKCLKICPIYNKNCKNPNNFPLPEVYAAKHKEGTIRKSSSSGGAFSAISDCVIENKGIIAGAAFDKNLKVCHEMAETKLERDKFQGSKYVQSFMGDIFVQIKDALDQGNQVLFSGTPCQIAGLYAYLKNDYENLFTLDVVCHGVPSPMVFEDYKSYLKRKYKSRTISFMAFRHWNANWRDSQGMKIIFEKGSYEKFKTEDFFYRLFLGRSFIIRPSCHNCPFCSIFRIADITLGDFWKIDEHHPDFASHKNGVSLVLINTRKGKNLFEDSKKHLYTLKSNINKCKQRNLYQPTEPHPYREYFWKLYNYTGFTLAQAYARYGIIKTRLNKG